MALAMQTESTEVDSVLAACCRLYAARRLNVESLDAVELRDGRAGGIRLRGVVVHEENRIECVAPRGADVSVYAGTLDALARAGWEVWMLVPIETLGSAHRHLRGVEITLQPWWDTEIGIVFGRPETP